MEVKIKFAQSEIEYEVDVDYGMEQGIKVIEADKYVLIHYTPDGDYVEIYDDLKQLLKRVEEYYGDEIKQALLNTFKEYYGDDIKEILNNE